MIAAVSIGAFLAAGTTQASERDIERVAGTLFGAIIGAAVGDSVGGHHGAAVGGFIGATVGLAATGNYRRQQPRHHPRQIHYDAGHGHHSMINRGFTYRELVRPHKRGRHGGYRHRHRHGARHAHRARHWNRVHNRGYHRGYRDGVRTMRHRNSQRPERVVVRERVEVVRNPQTGHSIERQRRGGQRRHNTHRHHSRVQSVIHPGR